MHYVKSDINVNMTRVKIYYVDRKGRPQSAIYPVPPFSTPDEVIFGFLNDQRDLHYLCSQIAYEGNEWHRLRLTPAVSDYA